MSLPLVPHANVLAQPITSAMLAPGSVAVEADNPPGLQPRGDSPGPVAPAGYAMR